MDEVTELGDMKERLMMSMLPTRTAAGGGGGGGGGGDGSEAIAGGFATLEALNDEMDEELDALMEKLGSVKHQFSSLEAQRRALQVRLRLYLSLSPPPSHPPLSLSLSPCSCGEWAIISAASQREFLNTRHFSL